MKFDKVYKKVTYHKNRKIYEGVSDEQDEMSDEEWKAEQRAQELRWEDERIARLRPTLSDAYYAREMERKKDKKFINLLFKAINRLPEEEREKTVLKFLKMIVDRDKELQKIYDQID
jgi:hypothetical protein